MTKNTKIFTEAFLEQLIFIYVSKFRINILRMIWNYVSGIFKLHLSDYMISVDIILYLDVFVKQLVHNAEKIFI